MQSNFPFVAQNGLVVMEAESVPLEEGWEDRTDASGYTGTGYRFFTKNSFWGGDPVGRTSYFFDIDSPGIYSMFVRAQKDHKQLDLANDCYVKMVGQKGVDGKDVKLYLGGNRINFWRFSDQLDYHEEKFSAKYNFEGVGTYELQLSGRSQNFAIDRIVLYKQGTSSTVALDPRTPESPRREGLPIKVNQVEDLELYTAGNSPDAKIQSLQDGDTINIDSVGSSLSILGDAFGDIDYTEFSFNDGNGFRKESMAPYAMGGDSDGTMTPVPYLSFPGEKNVLFTAYKGDDVVGEVELTFTLIGGEAIDPTIPPSTLGEITGLVLTTAGQPIDTDIKPITEGSTIDRSVDGSKLGVKATTNGAIAKVIFSYEANQWIESVSPYVLDGNSGTTNTNVQYLASNGSKTITVRAYDGSNQEIDSLQVSFTVSGVESENELGDENQSDGGKIIQSFDLFTAGNDQDAKIQTLSQADTISQQRVGSSLSILINAPTSGYKFVFEYGGTTHTEGWAPYAMAGNMGKRNSVAPYLASLGSKTIVVQVYDLGKNQVVETNSLTFDIVA